jgi:hypothetical protein
MAPGRARAVAVPTLAHLATLMDDRVRTVVPNLGIMEIDPHVVPWSEDWPATSRRPRTDGHLILLSRPGLRTAGSEAAFPAYPSWKR